MRYTLKYKQSMKAKEIFIRLEDIKYMNEQLKKNKEISGFIFGFEKV